MCAELVGVPVINDKPAPPTLEERVMDKLELLEEHKLIRGLMNDATTRLIAQYTRLFNMLNSLAIHNKAECDRLGEQYCHELDTALKFIENINKDKTTRDILDKYSVTP